jgi:hypothetical protein
MYNNKLRDMCILSKLAAVTRFNTYVVLSPFLKYDTIDFFHSFDYLSFLHFFKSTKLQAESKVQLTIDTMVYILL